METALWLHSFTDQATGFHINWPGIMFDIFVISTFALVGLNYAAWRRQIAEWVESRKPVDVSAHKAMIWICYWTHLGDSGHKK